MTSEPVTLRERPAGRMVDDFLPSLIVAGEHGLCAGCGEPIALRSVVETIEDRTPDLLLLSDTTLKPPRSPGDGATSASPDRGERTHEERVVHRHPRNVRVLPRSRDFH